MNYEVPAGYALPNANLLDYASQPHGSQQPGQDEPTFAFSASVNPPAHSASYSTGAFHPQNVDGQQFTGGLNNLPVVAPSQRQPTSFPQTSQEPSLYTSVSMNHNAFVPVSSNPEAYSLTAQTPPQPTSNGPLAFSNFQPPFSPAASTDTPNSEYSMSTDTSSITSWMSSASSYSSPFSVKSSVDHRHQLANSQAGFWSDSSISPFPHLLQNGFASPSTMQQAVAQQPSSSNLRLQTPPPNVCNAEQMFSMSPMALRRYASALSSGREALPPLSLGIDTFRSQHVNHSTHPPASGPSATAVEQTITTSQPLATPVPEETTAVERWVEQRTKKALGALSTMLSVLHSLEEVVNAGQRITVQERVEKTTLIDRAWVELQTNLLTEDSHPPPDLQPAKALTPAVASIPTPVPATSHPAAEPQWSGPSTEGMGSHPNDNGSLNLSLPTGHADVQASSATPSLPDRPMSSHRAFAAHQAMPLLTHTRSSPNLLAKSAAPSGMPVSSNTPFTDAAVAGQRVPMALDADVSAAAALQHHGNHSAHNDFGLLHQSSLDFQNAIAFRRANDWAQQMAMQTDQSTPSAPPTPYNFQHSQYDIIQSTPSSPGPHSSASEMFNQLDGIPNFHSHHQPTNPRLYDRKLTIDTTTGSQSGLDGHSYFNFASQHQQQDQSSTDGMADMLASRTSRSTPSSPTASTHASFLTLKRKRSNTLGSGVQKQLVPMSPMAEEDENQTNTHASSDVPSDYRGRLDTVFLEWLNDLCNDLDATDSKGELIHQVLMPKKMQRLEESKDFRPFKFRIQAFTNRFIEELSSRGFNTEEVSSKLIRSYLWTQPLISRFNEEGKKAKSKGNHVWTIDARRLPDTTWDFRAFERRIIPPSSVKISAQKLFQWEPRVWDSIEGSIRPASCVFTRYPSWLTVGQNSDQLVGTPTVEGSAEVQAMVVVMQEGQPQELQLAFELTVIPSDGS